MKNTGRWAAVGCLLLVGCDSAQPSKSVVLSVCEAIDQGNRLLDQTITVEGWLDISRHESILGDRECPSEKRFAYLRAAAKHPLQIDVERPDDKLSQQVAADLRKNPVGVEWGMRGRFIGKLEPRPTPVQESPYPLDLRAVPYVFIIERIEGLKVERPPYHPPPLEPVSLP